MEVGRAATLLCLLGSLLSSQGQDFSVTRTLAFDAVKEFQANHNCHRSCVFNCDSQAAGGGVFVEFCYNYFQTDDFALMGTPARPLQKFSQRISGLWNGKNNAFGTNSTYHTRDCFGWSDIGGQTYSPVQGIMIKPVPGFPNLDIGGSFVPKFDNRPVEESSFIDWKMAYTPDGSDGGISIMDTGKFRVARANFTTESGMVISGKDSTPGIALTGFDRGAVYLWMSNTYNNTKANKGLLNICDDFIKYRFRGSDYLDAKRKASLGKASFTLMASH